jgi:uncharacterized protein YukE
MAVDDGFIKYNHDALHETVQQMFNINNQITDQMGQLEAQVKQNQQLYISASSDQYGQAAKAISAELLESTEKMHTTAGNVQDGSDELEQRDKKLANLF